MPTYAERLVKVRDAIDAILTTGQGMTEQGRQLQMANLSELRKLEKDYEREAAAEVQKASQTSRGRNRLIYVTPK